jgi:phage terminase large subunit GpA-like protein
LAPLTPEMDLPRLEADTLMSRINQHDRGLIPTWATLLTAGIDVHDDLLYYCVCAWGNSFGGAVIDYGTWPKQGRQHFALRDANPTMTTATGVQEIDGAIHAGLQALTGELLGKDWPQDQGVPMRVSRCLVDLGYKDYLIYRFIRQSQHAAVMLGSKGVGITAGKPPMSDWKKMENEKREVGPSPTWCIRSNQGKGRYGLFDSNFFKSFVTERLLTPLGVASAMTLFGSKPDGHRLFADHVTAEYRERTEGRGRRVDEWSVKLGHDNHFLDVLVQCAVAASMLGCSVSERVVEMAKKPVSFAEMQRRQLAGKKPKTEEEEAKEAVPQVGKKRISFAELQRQRREGK